MSNSLILIDAKNALYRHQNVHNFLSTEAGFPTGALFGCLNSMISISKRIPEAGIVWVWDGRGETWRHRFMSQMPQIDAFKFPELEDGEDDSGPPGPNGLLTEHADAMIQGSLDWLGLNNQAPVKKKKKRGYKANRVHSTSKKNSKKEYPETPHERALLQIPVLQLVLKGCGIRNYEIAGLEGDDLLAMVAKRAIELDKDVKIYIHSGDRDYYQLLAWPQVQIIKNLKDGVMQKVRAKDVLRDYGVKAKHWSKFRALTGDSSDNIPNLHKVGSVTAKRMLSDGLDPSLDDYTLIPKEVCEKYARHFPHGIARMWPSVQGNFKLCKLIDDPYDLLLSKDVREKTGILFERLNKIERFYRSTKKKTPDAFRRVSFLLNRYELSSIFGRREELWRIP